MLLTTTAATAAATTTTTTTTTTHHHHYHNNNNILTTTITTTNNSGSSSSSSNNNDEDDDDDDMMVLMMMIVFLELLFMWEHGQFAMNKYKYQNMKSLHIRHQTQHVCPDNHAQTSNEAEKRGKNHQANLHTHITQKNVSYM